MTQLVEQGHIDSDSIYMCTRAEINVENDYLHTIECDENLERLRGIYRDSNSGIEFEE